jgi:hypothetical protein
MNTLEWIILVSMLSCIGIVFCFYRIQKRLQTKALVEISAILAAVFSNQATIPPTESFADLMNESIDKLFLVKMVRMSQSEELIITNRHFWCVNDNPGAWRRSSKPNLVTHVAPFVDYQSNTNKKVVKICVITPDCRNITRYLNEADVEVVKPMDVVWGVHFVRIGDLADYLSTDDQKQFTK